MKPAPPVTSTLTASPLMKLPVRCTFLD